ncbi:unnamed protein product [Amoebophrya sp. A120]|nr:unnamed protein product [Amoebophrya sp. A120]|eukprot:GSA120T00008932001.1
MPGLMRNAEKKNILSCSCCCLGGGGSFGRWALRKMGAMQMRAVPAEEGKRKTWDDGLEALFTSYCRGHEGGDERAWDVVYQDPFLVTLMLDAHIPGTHSPQTWTIDMRRGNSKRWSYDPAEITAPCFIYMGEKEETPIQRVLAIVCDRAATLGAGGGCGGGSAGRCGRGVKGR